MSNQRAPIIKKVKKVTGGSHHGGSWKVAYADFVTAMMAFFLLMWLLNMSSPEKRVRLSYYFKHFSIFQSGGRSFMSKSDEMFSESGQTRQKVFMDTPTDKNQVSNKEDEVSFTKQITLSKKSKDESASKDNAGKANITVSGDPGAGYLEGIEKALKKAIVDNLGDIRDQVLVDTVKDGVRIQMIDKKGSEMFEIGSNRLTPRAKEVLHVIGNNINRLSNKIIIEGHTDSLPYAGKEYSNWELSTERASSARRELESIGLDPERIMRVAGYADTDPLFPENPADPRNRRISITLKIPLTGEKDRTGSETPDKKEELNSFINQEQKLPALVIPGRPPFSKNADVPPAVNTDDHRPAALKQSRDAEKDVNERTKDTGWGPVINRENSEPIVKPAINLSSTNREMIRKDWVPKSLHADNPDGKETEKPAAAKTEKRPSPPEERRKTASTPLKKLSPLPAPEHTQDAGQKSGAEQWNPVVKENTWNPVLKKDEWNPVLDNK